MCELYYNLHLHLLLMKAPSTLSPISWDFTGENGISQEITGFHGTKNESTGFHGGERERTGEDGRQS